MFFPIDHRRDGCEPRISEKDVIAFGELRDIELPDHVSLVDLDHQGTIIGDLPVFGVTSIGGSDVEWFAELMGGDSVLSHEHPANECPTSSGVDNGSGLQRFPNLLKGEKSHRDSEFILLSYSLSYKYRGWGD